MDHVSSAISRANPWMDLEAAADYVGVPFAELLSAATQGFLTATVTHPRRPGEWLVRMDDVDQFASRRPLAWSTDGSA